MKLKTFFEKFDWLANAPGAVAKLRELVLELAVQGRLVPQHAKDETAHALLGRVTSIAKSRSRDTSESENSDEVFPIPETWAWVRLPRVLKKLTDGTHHSPPNGSSGAFMYVTAKNIKTDGVLLDGITYVSKEVHNEIFARCDPSLGDILYIKDGATTGIATINQVKEPFSMLSSVALLKPSEAIFNRYLLWAMRSPFFYAETRGAMKGAAITRVTLSVMAASLLPLPPLAEQKRIVAKVDELMALCDRLEAQQQERETRHATLARASLARFADAPTPANLSFLFHPSYAIPPSELRKSILTLAVQGKLVPQDPSDEPAEKAIRRVAPQPRPARFDKRSTANIQGLAALSVGQTERDIPTGWSCVPLIQVARLESGHTPSRSRPDWWGGDVSWVGLVDARIHNGRTIFETLQHTNQQGLANSAARMLPAGTVCVSRTASVGYVTILGKPMATSQDFVNWVPSEAVTSDWLRLVFTSEKDAFNRFSKGAVHQTIYYPEWLSMHVLLPPLAEQRRIVAKVEQQLALVDELETHLAASFDTAASLLSAFVAELTGTTGDNNAAYTVL